MGKLEGKVAIVTGAGQGIGKGIALAFAKEGAKVAIAEINPKTCEEVAKEIRHLGKESLGVVCNAGDNDQVKKMVKEVVTKFGTVDILVNTAYGNYERKPVEEFDESDFDKLLQQGLKATWYCCVAVFPYMKDRGGKIINFGSATGIMGLPGTAGYSAAKEGIRGFTRVAAREWGKYKINMNVICPFASSPKQIEYFNQFPEEMNRLTAALPLGRIGDPEKDIGRVAVFLVSEDSDYMTGQTVNVDGGSIML
jgi:NAD(P)-dependent dehydrogenase (short-subunit alcohol dehydrogenase family)